jgi:hypothetical protein
MPQNLETRVAQEESISNKKPYSRRNPLKLISKGLAILSMSALLANCSAAVPGFSGGRGISIFSCRTDYSNLSERERKIRETLDNIGKIKEKEYIPSENNFLQGDYIVTRYKGTIEDAMPVFYIQSEAYAYDFIKPEQVKDELRKINFNKRYHPDTNINKVINIINYIHHNFEYEVSQIMYPYQTLKKRVFDCESATALGLSMVIAAGIDKKEIYYASGWKDKLRDHNNGHAWGIWNYKDRKYLLEFTGKRTIYSLPEVSEKPEYFPLQYCSVKEVNRVIQFGYDKRKK